ncbi:hypothetical protein Tco_0516846 [Tanacetum coccineum]
MASASKDPLTFNNLMATHIDFFNIELEYNFQECFNLLTYQADWNNQNFDPEVTYTTSITKTNVARNEIEGIEYMVNKFSKQNVYSTKAILGVKLHGYGHLEEIVVKRSDQQLYKFKEGDFVHLHLDNIEDMLLLAVQHKLFHLDGNVIINFIVALRMFTRSLILKRRVEDLQLGVESYQNNLNITKPQKTFLEIESKEPYTPSYDPPGIVYEDLNKHKRVLRADELYKFSDGTLKSVRDEIHHRGVVNIVKDHKRKHDDDKDDDKDLLDGPNQGSKTGKSVPTKEQVEEPIAKVIMDDVGDDLVHDDDQLQAASKPKTSKTMNPEWFKQPQRPPTPDPEWNKQYLKTSNPEVTYTTSITKTKAARYEIKGIKDMVPILWSTIKHVYDKDALMGIKHWGKRHKLWNVIVNFIVALCMFTRSPILKKRVEDLQLGVESYQKKLNITKPQKTFPEIEFKEPYTPSYDPTGIVYKDLNKQKRVLRADELYKFSDVTLKSVRDEIHHRILDFHLDYNTEMPKRKWTAVDQRRLGLMVDLIDKQLGEKEIIRNLERLVGSRELELDYKLITRIV